MQAVESGKPIAPNVESLDDFLENLRSAYRRPHVLDAIEDERRKSIRIDLQLPVRILPVLVEEGRLQPQGEPIAGTTSNISLQGVALTHSQRLLDFYAAVTFDGPGAEPVSLLVELQWTFQETDECYRSGARFVGLLEAS